MNTLAIWRVISAVVLVVYTVSATEGTKRFDGYKVYRAVPTNQEQLNLLKSLENGAVDDVSVWNSAGVPNGAVDVMVSPATEAQVLSAFRESGVSYEILIKDVQSLIDNQNPEIRDSMQGHRSHRSVDQVTPFNWTAYHRLDTIYHWLDGLAHTYPDLVEVLDIGSSYEGRSIKGIKITFNESNPGIFVEGGLHAREWISPAFVTYLINEILSPTNEEFQEVARAHTWFIFPNLNPDGYEYSHTVDRVWRKTRRPYTNSCVGADPNRNWDFKWMTDMDASTDPCSTVYGGPEPYSEVEVKALADYVANIKDTFYIYLSFHNYGQKILFPYGYTSEHLGNYNESMAVATAAAEALAKRHGTKYVVGTVYDMEFQDSGSITDFVKGVYGTRFVYCYKLPDTSNGPYYFYVPAKQIIPIGLETVDSLTVLIREAQKLAYPDSGNHL